jgi:shikimate dehydrogenase
MFRCYVNGVLRTVATLAAKKQAEVWGAPISHSLSPVLHNTAYRLLALDASYRATEVDVPALPLALARLDESFLGVSLTMPLKEAVLPLVSAHRGLVEELGAANTVVMGAGGPSVWNTDPAGVTGALGDAGVSAGGRAVILGSGATARAVIVALAEMGWTELVVASRDRVRAARSLEVAKARGLRVSWVSLEEVTGLVGVDLVANTVPNGVDVSGVVSQEIVANAALFDVAYSPWPSLAALRWESSEHPVVSGLAMLVHQAVIQIRLFTTGNPETPLPKEPEILAAMKTSVGLSAV